MTELLRLRPKPFSPGAIDWRETIFHYDEESDTLMLSFYTPVRPAVTVEFGETVAYRVDPETQEVVGLQVDAFLTQYVYDHPEALLVAEVAEVDPVLIERVRRAIASEKHKQAAAGSILDSLLAASA